MKFLFAIALFLGASNVFAATDSKTVSFSYWNSNSYYSCDYARGQAQAILGKLGAQNVKVSCSGGIEPGVSSNLPVDMKITFDQGEATGAMVKFSGMNDSCDFHVKLIDEVLKSYTHKAVQKQESCWDSQGRYSYQVQL